MHTAHWPPPSQLVDQEKLHPDTFKGAEKTFKKIPWRELVSTQSGGTFSTLVLRHSVVLVLGYSYSVVLSSTQLKPYTNHDWLGIGTVVTSVQWRRQRNGAAPTTSVRPVLRP